MTITITIPGTPVGKGRPRFARRGNFIATYTPEKTASYENLVAILAQEAMAGDQPIVGPVSIHLFLAVSPPASWSKKKVERALNDELMPTTKPDIDNSLKSVLDACNGIVWHDDKQVVTATVLKRYRDTPRAVLTVAEAMPL